MRPGRPLHLASHMVGSQVGRPEGQGIEPWPKISLRGAPNGNGSLSGCWTSVGVDRTSPRIPELLGAEYRDGAVASRALHPVTRGLRAGNEPHRPPPVHAVLRLELLTFLGAEGPQPQTRALGRRRDDRHEEQQHGDQRSPAREPHHPTRASLTGRYASTAIHGGTVEHIRAKRNAPLSRVAVSRGSRGPTDQR